MRFRKYLFTILALLVVLWIINGLGIIGGTANKQLQSEQAQASDAYQAGTVIGTGISGTIILCIGVPLFFLFALLAWRNGVGMTNKKRHEETLAALEQKQKE